MLLNRIFCKSFLLLFMLSFACIYRTKGIYNQFLAKGLATHKAGKIFKKFPLPVFRSDQFFMFAFTSNSPASNKKINQGQVLKSRMSSQSYTDFFPLKKICNIPKKKNGNSRSQIFASISSSSSSLDNSKEKETEKKKLHKVVFVLGGPGSGKGTQCAKLVDEFGFIHLSAGDLLRAERTSGSKDGQLIDDYIKQGKIVPVEISLNLLKNAMNKAKNNDMKPFLIDGFPRNFDNVEGWEEVMSSIADIERVLVIDCPEEILQDRLLTRGETSGRTDDNIETAKKRFKTYVESTMPVLEYYEKKGKLVRIQGDLSPEEVYKHTRSKILEVYNREEKS